MGQQGREGYERYGYGQQDSKWGLHGGVSFLEVNE